jgi:hypothetical protein
MNIPYRGTPGTGACFTGRGLRSPNLRKGHEIMCIEKSNGFGRKLSTSAAACAFALGAMSANCSTAFAQQSSVSPRALQTRAGVLRVANLEQAFWVCDYAATMRGMHATPVTICSAVTDELKNEKFGGDFEEMVKWWQKNKLVEHQKLSDR